MNPELLRNRDMSEMNCMISPSHSRIWMLGDKRKQTMFLSACCTFYKIFLAMIGSLNEFSFFLDYECLLMMNCNIYACYLTETRRKNKSLELYFFDTALVHKVSNRIRFGKTISRTIILLAASSTLPNHINLNWYIEIHLLRF